MSRTLVLAVMLTLAEVGIAPATERVRQQFQTNCLSCHQPPDLTFATDRAWLEQITRTA